MYTYTGDAHFEQAYVGRTRQNICAKLEAHMELLMRAEATVASPPTHQKGYDHIIFYPLCA